MELSEEDFALNAFAAKEHEFPNDYPLSYKEIAHHQQTDQVLQEHYENSELYTKETYCHSDQTCKLITRDGKISVPQPLQV